jgi:hypothetical protein
MPQPTFKDSTNILKYNEVLNDSGTHLLFIIPARTPKRKFRKRPESGDFAALSFLEDWLIGAAIERNPNLINNKKTKFLRRLHVHGFFMLKKVSGPQHQKS